MQASDMVSGYIRRRLVKRNDRPPSLRELFCGAPRGPLVGAAVAPSAAAGASAAPGAAFEVPARPPQGCSATLAMPSQQMGHRPALSWWSRKKLLAQDKWKQWPQRKTTLPELGAPCTNSMQYGQRGWSWSCLTSSRCTCCTFLTHSRKRALWRHRAAASQTQRAPSARKQSAPAVRSRASPEAAAPRSWNSKRQRSRAGVGGPEPAPFLDASASVGEATAGTFAAAARTPGLSAPLPGRPSAVASRAASPRLREGVVRLLPRRCSALRPQAASEAPGDPSRHSSSPSSAQPTEASSCSRGESSREAPARRASQLVAVTAASSSATRRDVRAMLQVRDGGGRHRSMQNRQYRWGGGA
mmetsp:Transcript_116496/g.371783  ORF Transcript_116496/g.371783 Transcript_116496/m.371783 type:complete len:357 (+) Transcript_116496:140-1210(+)